MKKGLKWTVAFLAAVAASVFSLAATAGEGDVLLDVATNYAQNVSQARCLSAEDAKKAVDEVFAKAPVYQKPGRVERVKRLIDDGMATLVRYEADRERGDAESADKSLKRKTVYKLFKKWMETELPEDDYGGKARIEDRMGSRAEGDQVAVYADGTIETSYVWLPEGDFIDLFGAAEPLELAVGAPTNAEEVVVVADVEIVDLATLANLAHVEPEHGLPGEEDACFEHSVCATYNVDMRVRAVRRGKCPFRRFCFSAVHDAVNASATGDWLFFRGMTLEVGLARVGGKLKINRFEPVFPYPPYSKDGIRIIRSGTDDVSPFLVDGCVAEDVREYTNWRGLKDGISGSLVALQYGDRELALFASTTNLVEGLYGIFPDYGPSVKITVYGDGESNFDYWRNAWFSESAVTIRSLGEDDGFKRTKEAETVAAGTSPDLDTLTKELSSIGFADVAGATYAQVSPYPADSGAFWTDEYIRMSGLALDERLSGDGWIVLPKDGAENAKFLAYGCVWWEARLEPPETNDVRRVSYDKARLARDVVLVCGYVEDAAELKVTLDEDRAADVLAFALHARQAGFAKESERIASALFALKESGDAALSGIRKRLANIAAEYPDFATWEKKELARKEELEKRRKADESDSDAEEEL